jgi:hypothetical protein
MRFFGRRKKSETGGSGGAADEGKVGVLSVLSYRNDLSPSFVEYSRC